MSMCACCLRFGEGCLCAGCRAGLRPVAPVRQDGLYILSAYRHEGSARRLVHLLKYHGIVAAGEVLVQAMARAMPADTTALVPVPRAWLRRARYGVDPAVALAGSLGTHSGVPVIRALRPKVWWPAHAGSNRASRHSPGFIRVAQAPPGAVLVDDVATTGMTLLTAGALLGVERALTATRALGPSFDRISNQEPTATAE